MARLESAQNRAQRVAEEQEAKSERPPIASASRLSPSSSAGAKDDTTRDRHGVSSECAPIASTSCLCPSDAGDKDDAKRDRQGGSARGKRFRRNDLVLYSFEFGGVYLHRTAALLQTFELNITTAS